MGAWDDAVENHGANERVQEADARLGQLRDRLEDGPALEEWDRLNRLVGEAKSRLAFADRALITGTMLTQLNDTLRGVTEALDASLAGPEDEPIDLAPTGAPAETLATVLVGWPPVLPEESVEIARDAVNGLRDAAQSAMANLEQRLREGTEQANGLRDAVANADAKNQESLERLRSDVETLTSTVANEKLRLDQAIQSNQAVFEQAQGQRASEFATAEAARLAEHNAVVTAAKDALEAATSEIEEKSRAEAEAVSRGAREYVDALEKLREQARDLVGVIGLDRDDRRVSAGRPRLRRRPRTGGG
jgi:hypothetical protein